MEPARLREEVHREWKKWGRDCLPFSPHSIPRSTQLLDPLEVFLTFLTALSFLDSIPLTGLPCHQLLPGAALTLGLSLLLLVLELTRLHCMKGKELVKSLHPGLGLTFQLFWEGYLTLPPLFLLPLSQEPSMLRTLRPVCSVLRPQEAKDQLDNKWVLQDLKACHLDPPECLQDLPCSLLVIKAHLQDLELYNCSKFSLSWGLQSELKALGLRA